MIEREVSSNLKVLYTTHERCKKGIAPTEDGKKPLIAIAHQMEIFLHPSYLCIPNIASIEEGKDVKRSHQTDNSKIHLAYNPFLNIGRDMERLVRCPLDLPTGGVNADLLFILDKVGSCWWGSSENAHDGLN